jgi:hypothetical protein
MSGPTSQQLQLQQEEIDAYQSAQQMTQEQYADQQAIYGPMAQQFQAILAKGPNQEGFTTAEENDLNAQAVEGTAENYSAAARATGEKLATEGGGSTTLTSGQQAEVQSQTAQSAAQEESKEESQIKQADYTQGLNEWQQAAGGLETIAAGENPLGFENAETSSGSAASTTASQIASEEDSWINAAIGAVGTAAGGWASGGFKTP